MSKLDTKIESWKKSLLDFGKRNRLINFKEAKRATLKIMKPECDLLYNDLVIQEKELVFSSMEKSFANIKNNFEEERLFDEEDNEITEGDLFSDRSFKEEQKTLASLRSKARLSTEEQGINTLYMTFGSLKWTENNNSNEILISPLILVPITITIESLVSSYKIHLHEDEIVINPTLAYKLDNDFGIDITTFDEQELPSVYFKKLKNVISTFIDWEITPDTHMALLTFLKINMYKDLENHKERIYGNEIISAIAGDGNKIDLPSDCINFNHDKNTRPIDTFQIMDADSSQQDAILLSKRNVSFVLQGPPGTGKSQTITNIISEALADGKKILFVSEKNAALQVVYKRLTNAGLSEFCLALHDYKASKKEILQNLSKTLDLKQNPTKTKDEAFQMLNALEEKREKLNKYQRQLHTVVEPLHKTIFEINGELAKLVNTPDLIFSIEENVANITFADLQQWRLLLIEFSRTIGKLSSDYANNPWYNCKVPIVTHELRQDINFHFKEVLPLIESLSKIYKKSIETFTLPFSSNWDSIQNIIVVLSIASDSPLFPTNWITEENLTVLKDETIQQQNIFNKICQWRKFILAKYDSAIINDIDIKKYKDKFDTAVSGLTAEVNPEKYDITRIHVNIDKILLEAENLIKRIDKVQKLQKLNEEFFDCIKFPTRTSDFAEYIQVLNNLKKNPSPTEKWFTPVDSLRQEIINIILSAQKAFEGISINKDVLFQNFDKEILDVDASDLLCKFRTEYKSIFRFFKSEYKQNLKLICSYYKGVKKISSTNIILSLEKVKQIKDNEKWLQENKDKLEILLGTNYAGKYTNWDSVLDKYNAFNTVYDSPIVRMSPKLKDLLFRQVLPLSEIDTLLELIKIGRIETLLEDAGELCAQLNIKSDIMSVSVRIKSVLTYCEICKGTFSLFVSLSKIQDFSYEDLLSDINIIEEIQEHRISIQEESANYNHRYGKYWDFYDTNWDKIKTAIEYAIRFRETIEEFKLPQTFATEISTNAGIVIKAKSIMSELQRLYNQAFEHFNWICNLFNENEKIKEQNLDDLYVRINSCYNHVTLLDEWIDFRSIREKCKDKGLTSYIKAVEEYKISTNEIEKAFLKRFYHLWLDAILPQYEEVSSFRTKIHEDSIKEFRYLDKEQQNIAKQRIRQILSDKLPDFTGPTSANDETGILRRELSKQRRIMPLRKLFKAIPNLMTSLKPCFMMSPLSVSIFLEADSYEFDLVIFDEASQVCTENAIGAIMRGKQAIIVGDSEQLPPTNFFNTTIGESDYDIDDVDADKEDGAYDSILDEALTVLPERSLLWHYRSKHEHLIAFSNAKIYGGKLITFPSPIDKESNVGVEYIYIQDGVYERSGKKCNQKEAQRVCQLVFEHYRKYPNRSLGVVTFSEAQQSAIETEIRQQRLNSPQFEKFFDEDINEPFFIKNLENVQGDERDTIIFSIGYAKDLHGVLYMNFGPLSREGGYRRLNVAITRAKYNIKLVGSIVPTDIEYASSEGVKMLRAYIDFAIRGYVAIEGEFSVPDYVCTESPFEESVYDFIVSKGYLVTTQVGCSGYRIDMAIKHPQRNSAYVLGIECDGATYHSSRTARERDRLRQTVLEDMGWDFYRIWSTDWVKDTKTQQQLLLEAIQSAIDNYSDSVREVNNDFNNESDYSESIRPEEFNEQQGYGFAEYVEADPYDYLSRCNGDASGVIEYIVSIEQPICKILLFRRMALVYGNKKVSNKVVENVEYQLRYKCSNIVKTGDALTLKNFTGPIQVRIPAKFEKPRDIDLIPAQELEEAIETIVSKSFGISKNALILETARGLGYARTGTNIQTRLISIINDLVSKSILKNIDAHITIVD